MAVETIFQSTYLLQQKGMQYLDLLQHIHFCFLLSRPMPDLHRSRFRWDKNILGILMILNICSSQSNLTLCRHVLHLTREFPVCCFLQFRAIFAEEEVSLEYCVLKVLDEPIWLDLLTASISNFQPRPQNLEPFNHTELVTVLVKLFIHAWFFHHLLQTHIG